MGASAGAAAVLTMATTVMAQTPYNTVDPNVYNYDDLFNSAASSSAAAATGWASLSIVWVCCIIIFAMAIPAALAVFVYKDAQKNHVDNPIVWALLTFFFNVIGLLIYFLAIRPDAIKEYESGGSHHEMKKPEHHEEHHEHKEEKSDE